MVKRIIKPKGYQVLEVDNGYDAIGIISETSPDCLILDLLMPGLNGVDVLNQLAVRGLTIPTIVMTADIQDSTRQKCLEMGAVAFLNKPPRESELLQAVNQALAKQTMVNK